MPIMRGRDEKGCYVKYGESGEKYYYPCGNPGGKAKSRRASVKAGAGYVCGWLSR